MGKWPRPLESLGMNTQFWRGRRVFLTGHTGFKGAWLSLWLQELGAEVTGYALAPATEPNLFTLARAGQNMTSVIADVRDLPTLQQALRESRPEVVIHMAAQPLVRYSYTHPVETYSTNVMGTVHLLEAVRGAPDVRAVVVVTTDKCYENREWPWGYRETDPMGGYDPYSNSKGCAELVSAAYRSSYFNGTNYALHRVALATARAGNVIGGGDWAQDRLIPDILAAFSAGHPVLIRNPNAIRPWQHVLEPLRGYLQLAEALYKHGPEMTEAWNFGPMDVDIRPVSWIVDKLATKWGDGASWQLDCQEQSHEATTLKLDISKVSARLGWRPHLDLEHSLDLIVAWQQAYRTGQDMAACTQEQIRTYQSRIG